MAVTPFEVKDYLATARERVTTQFDQKEVFDRYVQLLIYGSEQLQLVFKDLIQNRSLDTAVGAQLDIIGKIVGQERGWLPSDVANDSYFGWDEDSTALPFDSVVTPITDAGYWYSLRDEATGNIRWNDDVYRTFIKARIFANSASGTTEDLILATKAILSVTYVEIRETGNAHIEIWFNKALNPIERYILTEYGERGSLLPIPIGVSVDYYELEDLGGWGVGWGQWWGGAA